MTQKELNYIEDIHKVECLVNDLIVEYSNYELNDTTTELLKTQGKEHKHNIDDIIKLLGEM